MSPMIFFVAIICLVFTAIAKAAYPKRMTLEDARWRALAELESGNNPHAIGSRGEVSVYQIMPETWEVLAGKLNPSDTPVARHIAERVWLRNCRYANCNLISSGFISNQTWVLIWHCPFRASHRLTLADKDYAARFDALVTHFLQQ